MRTSRSHMISAPSPYEVRACSASAPSWLSPAAGVTPPLPLAAGVVIASPLLCLPPSRALHWLREACPRRRDTATGLGGPYAAFGPTPAASPGNRQSVSLPHP